MKNTIIAILLIVIFVFGATIVRVENERDGLDWGLLCNHTDFISSLIDPTSQRTCLQKVETRTSWVWHIFFAVKDTF